MFKEEILKKDCVVRCESEYQIKNLFKWLDSKGYEWQTGDELFDFIPEVSDRPAYIYIYTYKQISYNTYLSTLVKLYNYNDIITEPKDTTIDFMLDYLPDVKKIIHNDPATVLIFKDGSKSVVKCEQEHDLEKAILYAWVKKHKTDHKPSININIDKPLYDTKAMRKALKSFCFTPTYFSDPNDAII